MLSLVVDNVEFGCEFQRCLDELNTVSMSMLWDD